MVFTACLGAAFAPAMRVGISRAPCQNVPHFDPSVFQLSYGCADVATRTDAGKKNWLRLHPIDVPLNANCDPTYCLSAAAKLCLKSRRISAST